MSKFECGVLDHAGFLAIKDQLTAALAAAIESQLKLMGPSAKGISWFSSCAEDFARETLREAA